jgi:hypothetical protein
VIGCDVLALVIEVVWYIFGPEKVKEFQRLLQILVIPPNLEFH